MSEPVDFEGLLKESIGLDTASIGSWAVEHAVAARISACGCDGPEAYWDLIRTSAAERQALIEVVVVPETWFFRDRGAFDACARLARDEWLPAHPHGMLRALSLPCSTGEEPYSLAMALLDIGFPPERFCIDALDISARALAHAERAIYGKNSFRGSELGYRDRHFEAIGQDYRSNEGVRVQVQFRQGNLFSAAPALGARRYDAIFCRNLLIYFDRPTQERALQILQALLTMRGILFLGPSETGLVLNQEFVSIKAPRAFGFRKRQASASPVVTVPVARPFKSMARSKAAAPWGTVAAAGAAGLTKIPAAEDRNQEDIADATRLADQGRLVEAADCCDRQLHKRGPSAELFHLMGLIHAAAGRLVNAAQCYRKALYLDQHHYQTLIHLTWLLEEQGDAAGAQVLRGRTSKLDRSAGR